MCENRNAEMQVIFKSLTEKNKDILILVGNGIKLAQEENKKIH